jgi:hypothetical protein
VGQVGNLPTDFQSVELGFGTLLVANIELMAASPN